ncbi:MAG TPA: protein kinase [Polyangiales bacterium]
MADPDHSSDPDSAASDDAVAGALREIAHVPAVTGALRQVVLPDPLQSLALAEEQDHDSVPRLGTLVAQRYRLDAVLGAGGMGVVFAALHVQTDKPVALKWLSLSRRQRGTRDRAQALARFAREARAAGRINHPNVVDVYDASSEESTPYLVMERLEGETLRARITRAPLSWQELMELLVPAMRGVMELHRQGIVHRDLKPDNVFLARVPGSSEQCAKVLDFGVSRLRSLDSVEDSLTHTGAIVGTPAYMPLEQLRGDDGVDERTDVYALGVVLFEALTGRRPWSARSAAEYGALLASTRPTRLSALVPALKGAREAAIMKALERRPEDRHRDVASFIAALEQASRSRAGAWRGWLAAIAVLAAVGAAAVGLKAATSEPAPVSVSAAPVRTQSEPAVPDSRSAPPAGEPEVPPIPASPQTEAPYVEPARPTSTATTPLRVEAAARRTPRTPAPPTRPVAPTQALDALQPSATNAEVVKQPTDRATSLARDEF